ncbi:unnamed protein product [Leuciscus chuanchicus]
MIWAVLLCLTVFRLWDSCTASARVSGLSADRLPCRPAACEAALHSSLFGMAFSYSSSQLHKLNSAFTPGLNIPIINKLRILRRSRYAHRSTRRCFVYHQQPEQCIPSIWTPVAQLTRHQSAATKRLFHSNNLSVHDLGVSDHKAISLELPTLSPISKPGRKISFRNLKNINPVTLTTDLRHLSAANPLSVTKSVDFYNSSLSSLLDHHAPVKSRTVTFTRSAPWYTRELRLQRRTGRVLERRFKDSGLAVHKLAYREHQKAYSKSLSDTRSRFYSHIINNSHGNSKQLFSTINHLLKPQTPLHLDYTQERCNSFI